MGEGWGDLGGAGERGSSGSWAGEVQPLLPDAVLSRLPWGTLAFPQLRQVCGAHGCLREGLEGPRGLAGLQADQPLPLQVEQMLLLQLLHLQELLLEGQLFVPQSLFGLLFPSLLLGENLQVELLLLLLVIFLQLLEHESLLLLQQGLQLRG